MRTAFYHGRLLSRRSEIRNQIGETEPVTFHDLAHRSFQRLAEHRSGEDTRMELTVLAARIDALRQLVEERVIEPTAGE